MDAVIRYQGLAGAAFDFSTGAFPLHGARSGMVKKGSFLESYDPEYRGGRGIATWSVDPERALRFKTLAAAVEFWQQVPRTQPIRADGQPNRPLTAYTVEIGFLSQEEDGAE